MKKWALLIVGMGALLSGCTSNGTKEETNKEKAASTAETVVSSTRSSEKTTVSTQSVVASSSTKNSESTSVESSASTTSSETASAGSSTSTEVSQSATASSVVEQTLWNPNKSAQLAAFMSSWSQTMGQQYKSYTSQMNVDLYGLQIPQAILNGEWTMAIGESPVSAEWSENGTGQAGYQIVAVYSDAETEPYLKKHVYLFGFQQGQPKVLVTQQNQGNPNNYLYFKETENVELKNSYARIVNGEA